MLRQMCQMGLPAGGPVPVTLVLVECWHQPKPHRWAALPATWLQHCLRPRGHSLCDSDLPVLGKPPQGLRQCWGQGLCRARGGLLGQGCGARVLMPNLCGDVPQQGWGLAHCAQSLQRSRTRLELGTVGSWDFGDGHLDPCFMGEETDMEMEPAHMAQS